MLRRHPEHETTCYKRRIARVDRYEIQMKYLRNYTETQLNQSEKKKKEKKKIPIKQLL